VSSEARNGKEGQLIKGVIKLESNEPVKVPFTAWFAEKTGLLEEVVYDHTKRVQDQVAQMGMQLKVNKYVQRLRFQNVSVDGPVAEGAFIFKPGEYDQKVAELKLPTEAEWQNKLIGRPAPDFATEDLEGKKVKLSDLKGRVLLLDFWATWCGPCRMAMPAIQRLAEKYQKEPVTVLGMDSERPGTDVQVVKKVLDDGKITYRQLKCSEEVSQSYRISSIPYFVLVDKKGIVQSLNRGFSPDHEEMLAKSIDILLKGGTLTSLSGPATSTAPAAAESK
jgi:thiol-disulfide isomerase/thioredoxin